jgi:membrane-associated phospholipid phosphatase
MFTDFLTGLPRVLLRVFSWPNIVWHVVAAVLTAVLVLTGFDWWYFEVTRGPVLQSLSLPAAILGFFVPILLAVGLYLWGDWKKDKRFRLAGIAVGQASMGGWLVTSFYKIFTGRTQPEFLTHTSNIDISRNFHFGIWQHGIFWGWPSSHTGVAFAGMVALVVLFPKNKVLCTAALLYAFFIGIGVSVSIHWFSDFVAGAILGSVVGVAVARQLQQRPGAGSLDA